MFFQLAVCSDTCTRRRKAGGRWPQQLYEPCSPACLRTWQPHRVEPIWKVLPIAPSSYHDHVAKRIDPSRLSARAKRDEALALKDEVRRVFEANFRVYGVRKVWRELQREGSTSPAARLPH